jgi:hemerythrin-like metal-binding protein
MVWGTFLAMSFYEWSESMSVGVALLDSDHKALVKLINQLHNALEDKEESSRLDQIFQNLIAYIELHFEREEQVMEACNYPEISEHKEEHLSFTQNMYYMRDRYFSGEAAGVGRELLIYLKDWLNHHILIQDMSYKPYAEDNELADQVAQIFGAGLSERDS